MTGDIKETFVNKWMRIPYVLHTVTLADPIEPRATVVFLHGIGSSTLMWKRVAQEVPNDVRIVAIDLLGFGESPQPSWKEYSIESQTQSVRRTLRKLRIYGPLILVGHSLGALIAIEYAHRHPQNIEQLLLISPPLYKYDDRAAAGRFTRTQDERLRRLYRMFIKSPERAQRALHLARKAYSKVNRVELSKSLNITTYLATLDRAIIDQDVLRHLENISVPTIIMRGTRDPLVVRRNIDEATAMNPNLTHSRVAKGGHNVVGVMQRAVVATLNDILSL